MQWCYGTFASIVGFKPFSWEFSASSYPLDCGLAGCCDCNGSPSFPACPCLQAAAALCHCFPIGHLWIVKRLSPVWVKRVCGCKRYYSEDCWPVEASDKESIMGSSLYIVPCTSKDWRCVVKWCCHGIQTTAECLLLTLHMWLICVGVSLIHCGGTNGCLGVSAGVCAATLGLFTLPQSTWDHNCVMLLLTLA